MGWTNHFSPKFCRAQEIKENSSTQSMGQWMVGDEVVGCPAQDGRWGGFALRQHPWKRDFAVPIFSPCWFKYVFFWGMSTDAPCLDGSSRFGN